uniref:DNA repair protein Rad4 n=1 Tax=Kalanchoe fedtschenkoi TaxID=63787 RepID=A0A7N0TTM4_KALFE
ACKTSLRYVVAFAGFGAKDVTRRYCQKWYKIASKRVDPVWWDRVLAPLKELELRATEPGVDLKSCTNTLHHRSKVEDVEVYDNLSKKHALSHGNTLGKCSDHGNLVSESTISRDSLEDMELITKALTESLPTNQQAYKNHSLYVIERWLSKFQILHPKGPVLGFVSGHPVYPRSCVQTLRTKEKWLREGRQLKPGQPPAKVLKRSKGTSSRASEDGISDSIDVNESIQLYGVWQTEPLCLPPAVNGMVPKNERGQVDVWSEKCLPPGTVHLKFPRIFSISKRLGIDSAPAMVGFEFKNGRSFPIFHGIVVCSEFKSSIMEAYREEEERREAEERKQNEVKAISRWYQLLSSVLTRQRLDNSYANDDSLQTSNHVPKRSNTSHSHHNVEIGAADIDKEPKPKRPKNSKVETTSSMPEKDHHHVFLKEDEIFDEEGCVKTKWCQCGFSIQVEEM